MGLEKYEVQEKVGRGGHSYVYRCKVLESEEVVAIKKTSRFKDVQRELRVLERLVDHPHPHVVRFLETFEDKTNTFMVFEYLQMDMGSLMKAMPTPLSEAQARMYVKQLLRGLTHLHGLGIIHRDIKPSNLLVALDPEMQAASLKISDFGVAIKVDPETPAPFLQEGTIIYQPPELLFGLAYPLNVHHVDTWAVGCVLAEFLLGRPLFMGDSQIAMLSSICGVVGSPDETTWPGCTALCCYLKFNVAGQGLDAVLTSNGTAARSAPCLDLAHRLLQADPAQRLSPTEALGHPFLQGPEAPVVYAPPSPPPPAPGTRNTGQSPSCTPAILFPDLSASTPDAATSPQLLLCVVPERPVGELKVARSLGF